jgi:hypothetical protein
MIDEGSGCGIAELTVTNLLVQQQTTTTTAEHRIGSCCR